MSDQAEHVHKGGCLCGGVRYEVMGQLRDVWMCHCEDCRRVTGNHMAATACTVDEFSVTSDMTPTWFSRQAGVEYGFCATCGSTLLWRAADKPDHLSICVGTLDETDGLVPGGILFRAEAGDYAAPHPDVPAYDGDREIGR